MVEHNVKTKNLKAHIVGVVLRMYSLLYFRYGRISCYYSFYQHIVYPLLQFLNIMTQFSNSLKS